MKNEYITALYVEPNKEPEVIKIPKENELEFLQQKVGGLIECIGLYSDNSDIEIDMVVNDEGKLLHLPLNRELRRSDVLGDNSTEVFDIVYGPFLICGADVELGEFVNLPENYIEKFKNRFRQPLPEFFNDIFSPQCKIVKLGDEER